MAEALTPDICIVGGGPGGIAAALAARAEGVSVVLVEKGPAGGANLAFGSIPSKALVAAANAYEALRIGPAFGVTGAPLQVNLGKVRDHMAAVGGAVAPRMSAERLTAHGVKVISGAAWFTDRQTLAVGDSIIRARRFILAIGSVSAIPQIPGLETVEYATFADGIDLARKPAHLIILGAGTHALELAQAYNRLSIDTTVIDQGAALPGFDPELSAIAVERIRAEGVRIRENVVIQAVARRRGGIRFTLVDPAERGEEASGEIAVDGSHLLVATARTPAVEGLGLVAAGIAHDASGITVDRRLRTANRRVYAIGDAVAGEASVARAAAQAVSVVRTILFRAAAAYDENAVPRVAFTDPAIASVGLSERAAKAGYRNVRTHRFPFVDNERAAIERLPAGVIKVVAAGGGRILGASIVGRGADEMIALWSLAIANRLPLRALAALASPYPTRSDVARQVALWNPEAGTGVGGAPGLTRPWRRRIIEFLGKLG